MNRFGMRAAALTLAALLAFSPAASASVALGNEILDYGIPLSSGTSLTTQLFWSHTYSDLRTEHYFTYAPGAHVSPVVGFGDRILSKSSLTSLAKSLSAEGKRVLGGVNGDYFVMATGAPTGMVITDGLLRSSDAGLCAVGFRSDGTAFIGKPQLTVTASFSGHTLLVGGVNKVRTIAGNYTLFSDDFSPSTQNTQPGVDVILTPVLDNLGQTVEVLIPDNTASTALISDSPDGLSEPEPGDDNPSADDPGGHDPDPGDLAAPPASETPGSAATTRTAVQSDQLRVGGRVTCTVDAVLQSTGAVDIPDGKFVISINNQSNAWLRSELAALQPGDTVHLDITSPDARWNEAQYAVGGMYKLVTDGVVESGLPSEQVARSAVGIRADGTTIFYTIDGRQNGHSVGASLTQVGQRLVELDCVEAVCLDGGGSTTLGATLPDSDTMSLINSPSDGAQRLVTNAIFLVSHLSPTGVLGSFYVTPSENLLLAGASQSLTASPVDSAWHPMRAGPTVRWSLSSGGGSVDGNGVFTAGDNAGLSVVTASSGQASGSASLVVVADPDRILLAHEATGKAVTSLALAPGQSMDLSANAIYKKLPLVAQDTCFIWSVEGTAGTVDASGLFTAADQTGSGTLTVTAGRTSVSIPISVAGHILPLDDFEGTLTSVVSTNTISASAASDPARVRFGRGSLQLDYNTSADGLASAAVFLPLTPGERYLNLWVLGDGSGNLLRASCSGDTGGLTTISLTALDFTGWKQISAPLPDGAATLSALQVAHGGGTAAAGTIWLDQLTSSNELVNDLTPPVVTLSVTGGKLLASVVDNISQSLSADQVQIAYDGAALPFTWNGTEGIAEAALPAADGKLHRITVTATDVCGNIGRASCDVESTVTPEPPVFSDMTGHWADRYATYLYDHGVTTGVSVNDALLYQPDKPITRGEFALMVARWMGLDLDAYASVVLPFHDSAAIPDWALPGVRAMYALGIMQGSQDGAALNANAGANISRAEAMTLLGRIQAKGYAEPELSFDDRGAVPGWALSHVRSLVGQGVVGGYDNRVNPSDPVKRGEVAKMLFALR
ncbi:MAG: hypothetical protein GX585_05335 [Clostridiales bacterium]|nr:hypothetical protein [Clostridiales bacterium]